MTLLTLNFILQYRIIKYHLMLECNRPLNFIMTVDQRSFEILGQTQTRSNPRMDQHMLYYCSDCRDIARNASYTRC